MTPTYDISKFITRLNISDGNRGGTSPGILCLANSLMQRVFRFPGFFHFIWNSQSSFYNTFRKNIVIPEYRLYFSKKYWRIISNVTHNRSCNFDAPQKSFCCKAKIRLWYNFFWSTLNEKHFCKVHLSKVSYEPK